MSNKTCPYPGLRPFSEEESIFFKGRDLHIRQIIKQLEEKKITIITGASGDGKSSLVYAGVIPNARAGFFHAEYNNWLICDFRPERAPMSNLAQSLSENMNMGHTEVEEELKLGFSSLIKLYKDSSFYIDKDSNEWQNADNEEKKELKSKAANLFILADQFEEFFTNPENYLNGVPSEEAYATINVLLETASIAIVEKLPVYIVFTMRSDFISQSVAFTGLPEFIGYSQFFVPRLQRNELQQVIEEPAMLAGGKISKRLSETLINELKDGFDQLPVIQHTLSQLWSVANNGDDEMDLVHLVKLAGLQTKYLTENDQQEFNKWIKLQDKFKQKFYSEAELSNVLNTHANILHETAYFYYSEIVSWADENITEEDAKLIIKVAFQSLTKIDKGRAVRNRVSLREITDIINREDISYETVCGVLNVFRLPNNNFVRPYIVQDDIETQYLPANSVLDITHEALIRNWGLLSFWETEEKENYNDFQDFKIQLQRWLDNEKSVEFLLPLGTLTHFEKWYKKFNPNKYWIAKYDKSFDPVEKQLARADILAENIKYYLVQSRQAIKQKEKRKRLRRFAYFLASLVIIIVLSGFTYWAVKERENAILQQKYAEEQKALTEQQKIFAEQQRNKAVSATKLADFERLKAENSADEALKAKLQSDSAKEYAVFMQILAEEQSQIAKEETKKAKTEKQRADEQRVLAEEQKNLAEVASDSAQSLSYLALARALALKAQNSYENPEINLLLAIQAYKFNNEYGGIERHPDIYNALRYALLANGISNILDITEEKIISFYISGSNLILHTINNSVAVYDIENRKIISQTHLFRSKVPVNTSYFLTKDILVIGFEDKEQKLVFIKEKEKYKLKGHTSLIRSADLNPDKNEFATAGRDKTIRIWKLKKENQSQSKSIKTDSRVNAIKYMADNEHILAATNNGSIILWGTTNEKQVLLDKRDGTRAISIGISDNKNILAVGFDNGSVLIFYPNKDFSRQNYLLSNSGISSIDFNSSASLLSVSKENKRVDIDNLKAMSMNAIKIFDHDVKVRNLLFSKTDRLYGLCEDNTIRFWEKDNKIYANQVKSMISREFTKEEWELLVGKNVPYEKDNL
ncbi:MAG: hypothetical protein ABFS35_10210 [Bacteroidota bacterium]